MEEKHEERRGVAAAGAVVALALGGMFALGAVLSPDDDAAPARSAPTPLASSAAATSRSGPESDRFIREARMIGLGQSESDLIDAGRAVCAAVDSGGPGAPITEARMQLNALGLTADQRTVLIAASVENFCPQHRDALEAL